MATSELWVTDKRAMPGWARGRMNATVIMPSQGLRATEGSFGLGLLQFEALASGAARLLYQKYVSDPWTRDCQVRANVVGIAPRIAGPIINIPVHDNQEVKAGDLLFEIDPADYKTALDSAKTAVANMEANLRQKQQDLERETELLQKMYLHDKNFRPRRMLSPPKWLNRPPPEQT